MALAGGVPNGYQSLTALISLSNFDVCLENKQPSTTNYG